MKAFTYNHLSRQKQLHSRCSGASEKKSLDSRVWEMVETKIQCNAFISRWNIAHFPKKSKEETKQGKGLNETVPKTHTHQHEICICYVKIINFKIGFIKMYEFGKVLCEWIVSVSGVYVCVCAHARESRAFTCAEMGFSKIESQHKSRLAKKRQTKYKSHTTLKKIADTLSDKWARASATEPRNGLSWLHVFVSYWKCSPHQN